MKTRNLAQYAIALAIVIVGLVVFAGVPASTLLPLVIVLACPLMMLFMMKGMHGSSDSHEPPQRTDRPDDGRSDDHEHHGHSTRS